MCSTRLCCSTIRIASAVLTIAAVATALPSRASAAQVRLGMSGTTPTIEFLEDITMTVKAGAGNQFGNDAIGVSLPNVLSNTSLGLRYGVTPTPSLFLDYQFTPTSTLKHVNGPYATIGNDSGSSSPDFEIYTAGPSGSLFGTFKPGGFFTFFQGVYAFPNNIDGTSPWVTSPSTVTLTPGNFFFDGEVGGKTFLSGANWELTSSGPGPAPVPEIDPAGVGSVLAVVTGALGLLERRRVKVA